MNGRQLPKVSVDIKTISVRPVFRSRRTYAYYPFFIHCLVSEVLGILDTHRSIFGLYGRAIMRMFDYYMLYVRYRYHTHRKLFGLYGMAIMRTSYIHTSLYNFDKMVKKGKYSKIVSLYIVSFFDVKTREKLTFSLFSWIGTKSWAFSTKRIIGPPLPLHFCKKYLYEGIDLET